MAYKSIWNPPAPAEVLPDIRWHTIKPGRLWARGIITGEAKKGGSEDVRSCTPTLRTIPLAQKPGKMLLSHYALAGAEQPAGQWSSQWWSLATVSLHLVRRLFSRASRHDFSWQGGSSGAGCTRVGVLG